MIRRLPLVYLHGVAKGQYVAEWPVFVIADDQAALTFTVAVGVRGSTSEAVQLAAFVAEGDIERRYATRTAISRLHQQAFRARVLAAYRERCAVCRLRHRELLDAAHILPDGHPEGRPVVPNGLSLCTLHHSAFDRYVLGVTPDLRIEIRDDVLKEKDGPMLLHGLQGFHGAQLVVPTASQLRPNRDFLSARYELFRKAS
jgi:putative restriction endonuclease